MPLAILAAPPETELLVMEMAMRGMGQIAELCAIAEPDVAAITNVGPVHLELLGTFDAIVEAKAEILHGLRRNGRAVIPEDEEALTPHLRDSLEVFTFGPGGDVFALSAEVDAGRTKARIGTPHGEADFEFPFSEAHNLDNALCAISIGVALDLDPGAMAARAAGIEFSRLRGERIELPRADLAAQRLLQREPDLDARGGRQPRGDRPPPARAGRWRSSAGWPSSAPAPPASTTRSGRSSAIAGSIG